ncbi:MAG: GW dipeptide domain-containing protein [Saprospiraceae bacterium]
MKKLLLAFGVAGLLLACNSKPKVIEADSSTPETQQPMVDESATKLHKVVVKEILNTEKYSYLNVSEDGETFWIAIPKKEIEKGGTYYYRGGLKKTNFESAEYKRVFETLYLVSDVSKDPGMMGMGGGGNPHANLSNTIPADKNMKIETPPGGITISELFANRKKYEGQTVKIKGKCVKLNNMIMNRNWIHLQDGSTKDNKIDLTITTTEDIPLGAVVTVEGKITLNKDFGAGYKYEIIMEEAQVLQ